ncbi:hypothetical protein [Planomonospora parontospora]|uniref:hypothetical protein n=1 Tax=Planomonospora parontospora TaxID=58119 RepID=UPI00167149C3|nr:hypothetical protein [Planomonospora parontospora]GGL55345.1 hypothetical protein GCM10014719_65800 [Planomonospora parontospora subsp. antibiotica]GII19806.1 hypothetical protein Ppa05_65320 [Planomonospora parontospora subsp. antibiotica]
MLTPRLHRIAPPGRLCGASEPLSPLTPEHRIAPLLRGEPADATGQTSEVTPGFTGTARLADARPHTATATCGAWPWTLKPIQLGPTGGMR